MSLYTVLAPPPQPGEARPDPVRFVFVKDGFCWPALFIPELWLLFRRMWLVFVLYIAVSLVISAIGSRIGGPLPWVALGLVHLLFALEGNGLRRWTLTGRGYTFVGVAEGRYDDAELRFFSQWEPPAAPAEDDAEAAPPGDATPVAPQEARKDAAEAGEVVGLFPAPGGAA